MMHIAYKNEEWLRKKKKKTKAYGGQKKNLR